jgi:tripartite-type tricarboxylate transporter receptor subunit TctC
VKQKLHAALVASLNAAEVKEKFVSVGFELVANTPEQFQAFQKAEFDRWKQLIQARNITAN